jgi:acetyl esterase/lipase
MDVAALLDPEIAAVLPPSSADWSRLDVADVPRVRAQQEQATIGIEVPLSDAVTRTDHTAADGVVVRAHRARTSVGARPCVYWIHGGGYIMGSYATDDLRMDHWCPRFDCVGVSVEYRLAPEHPYPTPLDDCYAGLRWVHENAEELGVDRSRIGVAGASAGGGLAAALALLARDRGEIPLAFELLIYPMIDDRQASESSRWEVPIWPPAANTIGWRAYLGELYGGDVPMYAAPARAADLRGLPRAFIAVGALDGFLDEDVEYAMRLTAAGVPTELHVYPGAPHGFDSMAMGASIARRARRHMNEWLADVLHE